MVGAYFLAAVALAEELLDVGLRLLDVLPEDLEVPVPVPEEDGEPNLGLVPVVAPGLVDPDVPLGLALGDPNFGFAPVVEEGLVLRLGELKLGFFAGDLLLLRLGELKLLLPPLLGLADTSKTRPPTNSRHTIAVKILRRFIVRLPSIRGFRFNPMNHFTRNHVGPSR